MTTQQPSSKTRKKINAINTDISDMAKHLLYKVGSIGDVIGERPTMVQQLNANLRDGLCDVWKASDQLAQSTRAIPTDELEDLRIEGMVATVAAFCAVVESKMQQMAYEQAVFQARVDKMINDQNHWCGQLAVELGRGEFEVVRDELLRFGQLYEHHSKH